MTIDPWLTALPFPKAVLAGSVAALCALAPAGASAVSVTLAWDANTEIDLEGYRLYYDTQQGPPFEGTQADEGPSPITVPLSTLSDPANPKLELNGLASCEHFYFAVTAYDATNNESDYSNFVDATLLASPDPVVVLANSPDSLLVEWPPIPSNDSGNIPTYRVHYDVNRGEPYDGPGSPIEIARDDLTDPSSPSHVISGLQATTIYYVAVEAVCEDGTGNFSDEVSGEPGEPGSGGAGGSSGSGGSSSGGSSSGGSGGSGGTTASGTGATPNYQYDESGDEGGCAVHAGAPANPVGFWACLAAFVVGSRVRRRRTTGD